MNMNQDPNLKYIALNNFIHLFESDRALAFSDGVVVRLNKIHTEFASKIAEEKAIRKSVETSKIGGGLPSGDAGAFIVLTVATGGTSLVVLGLAAGASALLGWGAGEVTGWGAEKAYDIIEDKVN